MNSFYWDNEKKLEANLGKAAEAVVSGIDEIHNEISRVANELSGIKDKLDTLATASSSHASMSTRLDGIGLSLEGIAEQVGFAAERTIKMSAYDSMRNENLNLMQLNGELLRRLNEAERKLRNEPTPDLKLEHPTEAEGPNGEVPERDPEAAGRGDRTAEASDSAGV
jgi:hypothetical protein